jgi:sugar lactone lactonase YvrE
MTHDVFISYSNRDKAVADALCATLENRKIRCWIAPRDILPSDDYTSALITAISSSRILLLVFSKDSNSSQFVMREVNAAVSRGIPIIPFRIEDVKPTQSMEFLLGTKHWLDALTPPLERHLLRLADTVQTLLQSNAEEPLTPEEPKPEPALAVETTKSKPKKKKRIYLIAATVALIAITALAAIFLPGGLFTSFSGKPSNSPTPTLGIPTPTSSSTTSTATPIPTSSNSISSSGIITLANAAQVKQIGQVDSSWVHRIVWSPNGKFFAVASSNLELYDAITRNLVFTFNTVTWPNGIAFSPDNRLLAAGDSNGLHIWNVDGFGEVTSNSNAQDIQCLAFSPDGKTLAGGIGGTVKLFDAGTLNEIGTMPLGGTVYALAFSPDGKTLAAGGSSSGSDIKLWDVQTKQELKTLSGHSNIVESLAFSPNGQTLASSSVDKKIFLWNPTSGTQIRVITGHTEEVTCVTFSPDGQLLASASWDLTIRLWSTQTGQQLNSLTGHTGWVYTVAFSPDGTTLASGADDQAIRLWGL